MTVDLSKTVEWIRMRSLGDTGAVKCAEGSERPTSPNSKVQAKPKRNESRRAGQRR